MRELRITYSFEAYEWWNGEIENLATNGLFVRISPMGGARPFDGHIVEVDRASERSGAIKVRRGTSDDAPVESVVAEKIHVY